MGPGLLLVAMYIVLEHFAVTLGLPWLALAALALLAVLVLLAPLRARRPWAWALLALACALLALPGARRWAPLALLLPPTVVNAVLAVLFGHTLAGGRVPLVVRMVRLLHAPEPMEDPAVIAYARRVTIAWTALFACNALVSLTLALLAVPNGLLASLGIGPPLPVPVRWWSAFGNVGCYGLVALMFIVEYQLRKRRFPWQPYRNLFEFLARAARIGPRLAQELAGERAERAAARAAGGRGVSQ